MAILCVALFLSILCYFVAKKWKTSEIRMAKPKSVELHNIWKDTNIRSWGLDYKEIWQQQIGGIWNVVLENNTCLGIWWRTRRLWINTEWIKYWKIIVARVELLKLQYLWFVSCGNVGQLALTVLEGMIEGKWYQQKPNRHWYQTVHREEYTQLKKRSSWKHRTQEWFHRLLPTVREDDRPVNKWINYISH